MATPRFIRKTDLEALEPVRLDGTRVVDLFERLRTALVRLVGPDAAELFAEPVPTWGNGESFGSISWYARAGGEPRRLAELQADDRARYEAMLRRRLDLLRPALDDPTDGPLLRHALLIGALDGVAVLDDALVLTGWGLVPRGIAQDTAAMAEHFRTTLGRYTSFADRATADWFDRTITVSATDLRSAPRPAATVPTPTAATPSAPPPLAGSTTTIPPVPPRTPSGGPPDRRGSVWSWWLVPAAVAFSLAFLGLGIWIGWMLLAERVSGSVATASIVDGTETRRAIELQRETNRTLEKQVADAQGLLNSNVCTIADPLGSGADRTPVEPRNLAPPASTGQSFQGNLLQLLDQAIVLVVTADDQRPKSHGTGFFFQPGLVLTNRHVVVHNEPRRIFVTSRALGGLREAKLVVATDGAEIGKPDFAVLKVETDSAIQPLALTPAVERLEPVVSAGFPGVVVGTDDKYKALLSGDPKAIPEFAVTDGLVSVIQQWDSRPIIAHTATIYAGNSGGPLVDRCGRVVGVNTFEQRRNEEVAHLNYAQKSDTLVEFLRANNLSPSELAEPCAPPTPIAQVAPSSPAPGAPSGPPSPGQPPAAPAAVRN